MCEHGTSRSVKVKVPADLSHSGEEYLTYKKIDACIADIVDALNKAEVWTRSSCCGHNKNCGEIILQDGRTLFVRSKQLLDFKEGKLPFKQMQEDAIMGYEYFTKFRTYNKYGGFSGGGSIGADLACHVLALLDYIQSKTAEKLPIDSGAIKDIRGREKI